VDGEDLDDDEGVGAVTEAGEANLEEAGGTEAEMTR
jgi:hypothetical protein